MTSATPQVRATWNDDCACTSITPSPLLEPRYSPMIAPSRAEGAAILSPANRLGNAASRRSLRSTMNEPPPRERMSSIALRSADRSPSTAAVKVVKKTDSPASACLGTSPGSTMTRMGAMATSGTQ